jgi:hypothetical protein
MYNYDKIRNKLESMLDKAQKESIFGDVMNESNSYKLGWLISLHATTISVLITALDDYKEWDDKDLFEARIKELVKDYV